MDHAIVSPSAWSRWSECTRSVRFALEFENKDSDASKEGTLAHSVAEAYLKGFKQSGQILLTWNELKFFQEQEFYNEALLQHSEDFASYVLSFYAEGDLLQIEQRLDLSYWIEEGFGRSDANILQVKEKHLHVFDYKFGKGVEVFAEDNGQLKIYALGILDSLDFLGYEINKVTLHIYQPRIFNNTTFTLPLPDLYYWGRKTLKPVAKLAFDGEGVFAPGAKTCNFCPAKPRCKALADYCNELAALDFADPDLLSDSDILQILERKKLFEGWIKGVADYALSEAVKGKKWKGYKLVEGRADRYYKDESKIIKVLTKQLGSKVETIFKPKQLLGITELTKLLGTKPFNDYVNPYLGKPNGAPTLATLDDSRPVYNPAALDFKDDWIDPEELTYDNL